MGNGCCQNNQDINPNSKKLIRIINKIGKINENAKYTDTYSSYTDDFSAKTSSILYLQIYDVESDILIEHNIEYSQLDLDGISQISLENKLYLCGCKLYNLTKDKETIETNPNSFFSSFLFSINILKDPKIISYEVNSCYMHYYPSLTILKKQYIIVIGGYKSIKCEYYCISSKKWKDLPELPEERYGCTSICDNIYNAIYCFGGYNYKYKKNCMSVLKLNIKKANKWDTLIVMENSDLLSRKFSCIIQKNDANFIIVGGKNNNNYPTDDIVEILIKNKKIIVKDINKKLNNKVEFISLRNGIYSFNGNAYCFDEDLYDIIHKIENEFISIIKINQS